MDDIRDRSLRLERDTATLARNTLCGVLILPPGTDEPLHLMDTAALLWDVLSESMTLGQLVDDLAAAFHIAPERVLDDISPAVSELIRCGAIGGDDAK